MPHHLCKICNAFGSQPNLLNSINFDIFSNIKTWKEVREYYTPFLPQGFSPINDQNIASHKRHTDVSILLRPIAAQRQESTLDKKDAYTQLYDAGKAPIVDYIHMLDMMMRCRIEDLTNIERIVQRARIACDDAVAEYKLLKAAGSNEEAIKPAHIKMRASENRLFDLVEKRQKLWNELQSDLLNITGSNVEKEKIALRLQIMKDLHNSFNEMLKILSIYIAKEAFADNINQGRTIYNRILEIMNEVIRPVLKPLDASKAVIIKQKRLTA